MDRHVLLYSVYGFGPPPLPAPPTQTVEDYDENVVDGLPTEEEMIEYSRQMDFKSQLAEERAEQRRRQEEAVSRMIAFGIAGAIIRSAS